jgi:hypothetical protein
MTQPAYSVQPSPRIPKQTLLQLIATLSGVQTLWRSDRAPAIPGESPGLEHARIWLKITTYANNGTDEQRLQYDAAADTNDLLNVGQRQFTLSIRAECFNPISEIEAYDLCERIRFRLRTATARSIFSPANLALRDVQPIAAFEQKVDVGGTSRMIPCATMDVRWNWVATGDPNPQDSMEGNWIEGIDGLTAPFTNSNAPGVIGDSIIPGTLNEP